MAAPSTIALPERYRVERRIATGGMASVWAAHDEVLRRRVAVKVLSPALGEDETYHARFAREARAAARLSDCPHVVTIYDIGEYDGRTFIVMEHFAGGTVAARMQQPVARDTALRWLRETAAALDCAHGHGIVHRDVKPANLLLDDTDRLAVADFGIAHVADATRQLTAVGMVVGTAAYLSPEQALGEPTTSASDRYALAVLAFELLCGERPYRAEHPAAHARQIVEAPVPRITDRAPHLPRATDDALARGLAKDPAERPATAAELVDDLERALREPTTETTRVTQRIAQPPARRLLVPALLALVALLAAGTVVVLTARDGEEPTGAAAATTTTRAQRTATTPPARTQAPAATTPAPAPAPAPADGRSPTQLNDEGFALMQQERYAEAVPLLQRAVEGFRAQGRTSELAYAYALYNLAVALARTGNDTAAIPLLEERLRVSNNQRGVVRRELRRIQGGGR
ncbi:MAG: eukaryotic-like serine/threonine-protein kinase [Solirubrobacteraceae bacterium]|nr:eukaryotic-like serine/threonine-protein kinase [Solirubrobacteraceae bacterium]